MSQVPTSKAVSCSNILWLVNILQLWGLLYSLLQKYSDKFRSFEVHIMSYIDVTPWVRQNSPKQLSWNCY
jgi:hypothetical protein